MNKCTYLELKFWWTAVLSSLMMAVSSAVHAIWLSSWTCSGATIDMVGDSSSDMARVAVFMGPRHLTTSSAVVMSVSVNVQRSLSLLRTSGDISAAEIAGCCSRKRPNISSELFHRVVTSITSLCCGSWSSCCFSFSEWLAVVLRWKNATIRLTLPSRRAIAGVLSPAWDARLRRWAKQPMWKRPISCTALTMFAALSVTIAGFLSEIPHSSMASASRSARLAAVWLVSTALVCSTLEASLHSSSMWWQVIVR